MAIEPVAENTIRLYHRGVAAEQREWPHATNGLVDEQRTATWERPVLIGSPSAEGDQYLSTFAQDDLSGGFGIEDADEGVNVNNYRFGKIDARKPHQVTMVPMTYTPASPTGATGSSMPLGDIPNDGTPFAPSYYNAWGTHAWKWDWATLDWASTDNSLGGTPRAKGVLFNRRLYVAFTGSGGCVLEEDVAATGDLDIQAITPAAGVPDPLLFGVWSNRLWCLDKSHQIWQQTTNDASSLANAAGTWTKKVDAFSTVLILDLSVTPYVFEVFPNAAGTESLILSTSHGHYFFDESTPQWIKTIQTYAPHPDWGKAMTPWRGQEALWTAAGGLDIAKWLPSQVEVPLAGPSREQSVPPAYSGTIVSFGAERSSLYYLVKGLPVIDEPAWLEDPAEGEQPYTAVSPVPMWLGCWSGQAHMCLWDDEATTGEPTWMHMSLVADGYALWWGGTDGVPRYMIIPLDFYNPRAKVQLGRDEFGPDSWLESIRFDANMVGWDKLASHCFGMMDFADTDYYIDVSVRTDADAFAIQGLDPQSVDPAYRPLARIDGKGRTLIWFDNEEIDPISGDPWREGEPFQWIQYRLDWRRGSNTFLAPVMAAFSMHHLRIPQDSGAFTLTIPLHHERGVNGESPRDRWLLLKSFQTARAMIHLQLDNTEVVRGRVTGVSGRRWVGGNKYPQAATVTFVELGASSNLHTHTAA